MRLLYLVARDRLAIASRIITTPPLIQVLTVTLTLRGAMPAAGVAIAVIC
ncbi:MAG: hypothetical protein V7L31_19425 [Nostoc sp.]